MRYSFKAIDRCNMCGSPQSRVLGMRLNGSQGFRPRQASGVAVSVKRCLNCGLIYADPQPIPDQLSDHYGIPPDAYWKKALDWPAGYFAEQIADARRLLPFRPGMTALDVGAGLGHAMRSLTQAGFDTWGIEPATQFYDFAVKELDPARLIHTTIEDANFPSGSFDFITFGAVLEHLYDPRGSLEKARKWLKSGGIIHAEVPNSDYLVSKIINGYFRLRGTNYVTNISPMHSPFHLYEFTLKSFADYNIADHRIDVCHTTEMLPARRILDWWMDRQQTGMQITVYLRG